MIKTIQLAEFRGIVNQATRITETSRTLIDYRVTKKKTIRKYLTMYGQSDSVLRKMALFEFGFNNYTDIQYAALSGQVENLRRMLENGANLDCLGDVGSTALQLACTRSNEEIIDTILDFKPDMNITSINNTTALHIFIEHFPSNNRLLKRFLEEGADPNIPNSVGRTALHLVTSGVKEMHIEEYIRLLLQYKANVQSKDNDGQTPLHLAIFNSLHGAVSVLLRNGADIYNENFMRDTELRLARLFQTDYTQIMKLIVEHIIIQHVGKKHVIPEDVKVLYENEEFSSFEDRCHTELEKIKNTTVGDSTVTYYDIFFLPPNALAKKVSNPNIVQSFSEFDTKIFPIFGEYMFSNFRAGLQRLKAIEVGHTFCRRIDPAFPERCIDKIISFLTNEDLEKLQRVF